MTAEMSRTKETIVWEEKKSIGPKRNCLNNRDDGQLAIINATNIGSIKNRCDDIGKIKKSSSGIYKIVNIINGKYYVGSAKNFTKRWKDHRWELNSNKHNNAYLQHAWNKYGKENFKFIIVKPTSLEMVLLEEQMYLDVAKIDGKTKCYNLSYSASAPMTGRCHSEQTKRKFRETRKHISLETRQKMSMSHMGHTVSSATRLKLSLRQRKERHHSYDQRKYCFINGKTNETFTGTKLEFLDKFQLNRCSVNAFISGYLKSLMGWTKIKHPDKIRL